MVCEIEGMVISCNLSLSSLSRLSEGTARTGSGALEADAFGVLCESSSSTVSIDAEGSGPCLSPAGSVVVATDGASGLGSGGAKERGSIQFRGG